MEESMLYDLERDPEETVNRVLDQEYRNEVTRLSAQLKQIKTKSEAYLPNKIDP